MNLTSQEKSKSFSDLARDVISLDLCLKCGACVAACPTNALALTDDKVALKGSCIDCGICYHRCPQLADGETLAGKIFGEASKTSDIGFFEEAFSVRATSPDIRSRCQDGGGVTGLLTALLDSGFIDGSVVMGTRDLPWKPWPKVAKTCQDLLDCAGSKYSPGPMLLGLRDAVDLYSLKEVAVVGTPCQIKAIRLMQTNGTPRRLTDAIKLCIGIFCGGSYPYEEFFRKVIQGELNIDLAEVTKFDIKGRNFIIYQREKPKREISLNSLKQFVFPPCRVCSDYTAELADVSIGSTGSPSGWSTVILRSPVGQRAFNRARQSQELDIIPLEEVKPGIEAVKRASVKKRRSSRKEIERRKREGVPLPSWFRRKEILE